MRIGIDIRTLMDARSSGVPEYTLHLVKEILRQDKTNSYVLFYNSFRDVRMPELYGKNGNGNVEIARTRYPNKVFNYGMQKLLQRPKLDELAGGVDVFFSPHINFTRLSGSCRKIITAHDLSFIRYPHFFSSRKNFWHRMIGVKKLLRGFDIVVAVSEHTKRDIIELCGVPEEKVRVIYSGISRDFRIMPPDDPALAEVRRKYGLPERFILYLGTLEPRKNIEGIIRAYDIARKRDGGLEGVKLVIAGGWGWKAKSILREKQASAHGKDIEFLGYVNAEDRVYLYNLAEMFVYPSFYEGFGFPPLEAIACGCPVITSNASSLPEICGEWAVMVNPYNTGEMAEAIISLFSHNSRELAENRSRAVLSKYSWEKTAKNYIDIFAGI